MQTQKKPERLGKVVEEELRNLKCLDTLAWIQVGDYMAQVRETVNEHIKKPKSKRVEKEALCVQLKELDERYADSMEPRVLQFLAGMRNLIVRQIHRGRIRIGTIGRETKNWPKAKKVEMNPSTTETEGNDITKWMSDGFPID